MERHHPQGTELLSLIPREEALKIDKDLYRSDKVSIGAKLRSEEALYDAGEL